MPSADDVGQQLSGPDGAGGQERRVAVCPVCGGRPPWRPVYARWGFHLVRCGGCELMFQDPQPSDEVLAEAYYFDPEFTDALAGAYREWTLAQARQHGDVLARIAPQVPGRVLDVGCSSGAWLEVAAGRGWRGTGVELGPTTAEAARRRGLDVRTGTLADTFGELAADAFDLVTFWDVLEHVRSPAEELELARGLLAPAGRVAVSCPNVEGWYPRATYRLFARLTGVWEHPELPVHLWDFSPRTLGRLLERSGFRVVAARTQGTPFGALRDLKLGEAAVGTGRRAAALRAGFDVLHRAVYPLAQAADRANSMVVVAERRP